MLYQVGPLAIRVWPFNADKVGEEVSGGFAEKNVLGRRPPLEAVGPGPETLTLSGSLFPHKLGGISELELAKQMVRDQDTHNVMRGDGYWLGWYVLEKISSESTKLHVDGVGQVITYEFCCKRDDPPSGGGFFDSLIGFFL